MRILHPSQATGKRTAPRVTAGFQSAVLQGNEDAPYAVNLYASAEPDASDDYLRVTFDHEPPIYCEYVEFDGRTDKPKRVAVVR